jgi:hypothetical protein
MHYDLTLHLKTSYDKMQLVIADRDKNILIPTIEQQTDMLILTVQITMPNKILILLTDNDYTANKFFEVVGVRLGGLKFNNKKLNDLFEYKSDFGTSYNPLLTIDDYLQFESSKTTHWNRNGCVILELFDKDPVRYHLHQETTVLAIL